MFLLITIGILALLFVVGPLIGIGPVVIRGGNVAQNNAGFIRLPEDEVTEKQNNTPAGRKAQEVVDYWIRHVFAFCFMSIVSLLLFFTGSLDGVEPTILGFFGVIGWFLGTLWYQVFQRSLDLIGHRIEIIIAQEEMRPNYYEEELTRIMWDSMHRNWGEKNKKSGETAKDAVRRELESYTGISRFILKLFSLRF